MKGLVEKKLPQVAYDGELVLAEKVFDCAVLDGGTRVISESNFMSGMGMYRSGALSSRRTEDTTGAKIPLYLAFKNLNPYINKYLVSEHKSLVLEYRTTKGKVAHGIKADSIPAICEVWLDARNDGVLGARQMKIAANADILLRSLARVGIIALVDEATGYQYEREKDELQKILKAYISEELLTWQKRFPDIFYQELFRLNGWNFTIKDIRKRPGVIGTWTNKLIYEQLPPGVLKDLEKSTPKSDTGNKTARYHQFLTEDVGHPNLTGQINKVVALMQVSDNMRDLWSNFEKMKLRESGQLDLPFKFDQKGRTIDP